MNGGYELDIREILADHDVTGVDLIMTSSTPSSCHFVWVENDISKIFDFLKYSYIICIIITTLSEMKYDIFLSERPTIFSTNKVNL